ncbi:hypothetical protein NLU13_4045 [Sarocladium strictum]|uniref:NmrA-like domain-containing protein n=1 Tax=Sarocladium strictum TaxID=5046 RepID=A0AA39L8F6_SARSR|nr:hypothetical protein NLU13_4045 [Sarocladium strictum]
MPTPITFVCGATGTQGGALASALLSKSLAVRCLVRSPSSPAAQSLASRGAKIFPGSFDDDTIIAEALTGCTTVYVNFMPDITDDTAELRWATKILKIAGEKGVKHVIYSSSFGMDDPLSVPGVEEGSFTAKVLMSKKNIENEVRAANHVPRWTILRPGWFMTNFTNPWAQMMCPGLLSPTGVWQVAFTPATRLPLIDPITMGGFTAAAVVDPEKFDGKILAYCDELLRPEEVVDQLRKATERHELRVEYMPEEEIQAQLSTDPFLQGQYVARGMQGMVDMGEVKGVGIQLSSFEEFLHREKARITEAFIAP